MPIGELSLYFVQDVFYFPQYGVIQSRAGDVFGKPYAEAAYILGASPPRDVFNPSAERVTSIETGCVFMPWGACHNYGHFIIDAIGGAVCLATFMSGVLNLVCPTLKKWQGEALDLFSSGGVDVKVQPYAEPVLHIENAIYTSAVNHYLHAPTQELGLVGHFLTSGWVPRDTGGSKVYIPRSQSRKRVMVNETEVVSSLAARGFDIVNPEELSVKAQIELFSSADVIVSASGAALANLCFCRRETLVFEIQPESARNIWIRNICHHKELRWRPFFVQDRRVARRVIGGVERTDHGIEFDIDVHQLLEHLDRHGGCR